MGFPLVKLFFRVSNKSVVVDSCFHLTGHIQGLVCAGE